MSLFCLVHGSAQGPAGWNLLVPELEKRGHQSLRVDLPTTERDAGATWYAQAISRELATANEPAIVVAHSASGMFLPLVSQFHEIERMIFLAAVVPEPGRSLMQRFQDTPGMFNAEWIGKNPVDPGVAKEFLFHDCEPAVAEWALKTVRVMYARGAMQEPCPLSRWPRVPSSYILATEDRTINPEWWRSEVKRLLGAAPIEVPGGHCPYVSRPAALAEVLSALAN